jgi:hypothetical protein
MYQIGVRLLPLFPDTRKRQDHPYRQQQAVDAAILLSMVVASFPRQNEKVR